MASMKTKADALVMTLGEYAHFTIRQHYKKIIRKEKALLKQMDIEAIHQMRNALRSLQAALQAFNTALILPEQIHVFADGKVSRQLGKTRDLDVLLKYITTRYAPCLQEHEIIAFKTALESIRRSRHEATRQLAKRLKSKRYLTFRHSIHDWTIKPSFTLAANLAVADALPDLLLPLLHRIFLHPGWLAGTPMEDGNIAAHAPGNPQQLGRFLAEYGEILHDLRKQLKSLRYQAELFSGFYGDAYREHIEGLKHIQDSLGALHDRMVLRHFLETTLQAKLASSLPTLDCMMQQDDMASWQHWLPVQQNYLSREYRQALLDLYTTPTRPTKR
jgi:CHAD domain-containing protein